MKASETGRLLLWLLLGPVYLIALSLLSMFRFAKEMYRNQADIDSDIPDEVLSASTRFLTTLTRDNKVEISWISLKDVESALAHFPRSKKSFQIIANSAETELFVQRNNPFKEAADRIYFSKAQLANERAQSILRFFQQFASFCSKDEMQLVNVHRMKRLLDSYRKVPQKLVAVNITAVQAALLNMR